MQPTKDLRTLLTHMQPELVPGRYAFVYVPNEVALDLAEAVAHIHEPEGLSVIVAEKAALDRGLPIAFTAAWIMLKVHSDLAAVGLTAAFAQALGEAGISCNVVAGVHHDHVFVPIDLAQQAVDALKELSRSSS